MTHSSIIAVAGPSGVGKTTWIIQCLNEITQPAIYVSATDRKLSVELAYIGYRFPKVRVVDLEKLPEVLDSLSEPTVVYVELGFAQDLQNLPSNLTPTHRVALLPPSLEVSQWHDWADEIVPGNDVASFNAAKMPDVWTMSLVGQVFDAPSLDDIVIELTGGAYGKVQRMQGMFELPDGRSFHIDFVESLPGIQYAELNIPRWLEGRPKRFSGFEVVGWALERETIAQTVRDGCLSDDLLAQYHEQYKSLAPQ